MNIHPFYTSLCLLLTAVLFLAVPTTTAQNCSLPCIPCQNGGVCQSTTPRTHSDGQTFGTCICPTGFQGIACEVDGAATCTSTCHHRFPCSGSTCACGTHFTGADCMSSVCLHQASNGSGSLQIAPVDSLGKCGTCAAGFEGGEETFCRYPRSQAACDAIAPGSLHTDTLFSAHQTMNYICSSDDPGWVGLLDGPSQIIATCNKPDGSAWNDTESNGNCLFEFHRTSRTTNTREELFYCEFDQCSTVATSGSGEDENLFAVGSITREFDEHAGPAALRYFLFIFAALVGIVVLVPPFPHKSHVVLAGLGLILLFIILNISVAATQNESNNQDNATSVLKNDGVKVDLVCENTVKCYCNKNAKAFPNCNLKQFDEMVGLLKSKATLSCSNETQVCKFNHAELLSGSFDIIMSCQAFDCATKFPPLSQVTTLPTKDESDDSLVIVLGVCLGLVGVAFVASIAYHFVATREAKKAWDELGLPLAPNDATPRLERHTAPSDIIVNVKNICYSVDTHYRGKNTRTILDNVAASFKSGHMYAVMGPSGCGKTSLLDILCNRDKPGSVSGDVHVVTPFGEGGSAWVDDIRSPDHKDAFRRMISYAADDDAILPSLTVIEALRFAARLRQPVFIPLQDKERFVQIMIGTFKLQTCAYTVIGQNHANDALRGGLSQGERRRVAIALHLISLPRVLVLDEPTTGLDSYNARLVVQCLHAASRALRCRQDAVEPMHVIPVVLRTVGTDESGSLTHQQAANNTGEGRRSPDHGDAEETSGFKLPQPTSNNKASRRSSNSSGENDNSMHVSHISLKAARSRSVGAIDEDLISPLAKHTFASSKQNNTAARVIANYHTEFYNYAPIVIMTIHQPSSDMLTAFDEVMLFSEGQAIYAGPPSGEKLGSFMKSVVDLTRAAAAAANSDPHQAGGTEDEECTITSIGGGTEEHSPTHQRGGGSGGGHYSPAMDDKDPMEHSLQPLDEANVSIPDYLLEVAFQVPSTARQQLAETTRAQCLADIEQSSSGGGSSSDNAQRLLQGANQSVVQTVKENAKFYAMYWTQCHILIRRGWKHVLNSASAIALHFLISGIMTLFVSFMYGGSDKDIPGTLNKAGAFTFYLLWIAIVNLSSLDLFLAERSTYVFETNSASYSPVAYFSTKIILDFLLLRVIPALVGGGILYFPIGLRPDAHNYGIFLLVTTLFSLCTAGLCATIATLVPTFGVGLLVNGFFIVLFFAFGGFISQAEVVPASLGWIKYLSPFYYAFESLMINDLSGETCFFAPRDAKGEPTAGFSIPLQCEQYLFNMGIKPQHYDRNVAMLGIWSLVYVGLSFVFLVLFVRGKR